MQRERASTGGPEGPGRADPGDASGLAAAAFRAVPAHTCLVDGSGRLLLVNDAWRAYAAANGGVPDRVAEGSSYVEVCQRALPDCEEAGAVLDGLRDVLAGALPSYRLEYPCPAPGGDRWFVARISPVVAEGAGRLALVAHEDVTDVELARVALAREAGAQLARERKARAVQEEILRETRLSVTGALSSGVAHEINNPLACVAANLAYALDELDRAGSGLPPPGLLDDLRSALEDAREGAQRIDAIVHAMRALGGTGSGDEPREVDVRAELLDALRLVEAQLARRARLSVHVPERLPPVRARPSELGRAFLDVLVNALEAVSRAPAPAAAVAVSAAPTPDGEVLVEVADSAEGVEATLQERTLDASSTTEPAGRGAGLGLTLARSIVSGVGGRINLERAPGRGTTVRIHLPCCAGADR